MVPVPTSQSTGLGRSFRRHFAIGAGSYAGADRANAARILGLICSLSALLTLVFLPLDPPTDRLGGAGWGVAGVLIALGILGGRRLRRHRRTPSFEALLLICYLGLGQVLVLAWLTGDPDSSYRDLTLIWIGAAMGIHPAARAIGFLLVAAVVTAAPATWEGWTASEASGILSDFLLWAALGLVILGLMSYVRSQRVELKNQEREAQELARADPLTNLGNRLAFDEALDTELARSRRASSTSSIALLDLDRLKQINDRFGHLEGDRCLRETASAIGRALRAGDRAFRWGGDEFALVLPDTDLEGAEDACARIASEVLNNCTAADGTPLSISWGTAQTDDESSVDELLGRADLALMALKREKLGPGARS